MKANEFRNKLTSISDDLTHCKLTQDEALFKLKEILESYASTPTREVTDKEIDVEREKRYADKVEQRESVVLFVDGQKLGFKTGAKWMRDNHATTSKKPCKYCGK